MLDKKSIIATAAVVAALAAVAVTLALVAGHDAPGQPAIDGGVAPAAPKAPFPRPPAATAFHPPPDAVQEPTRLHDGRPGLCAGCLPERAVLDVVETYLRHLDPVHLHGGIWAHPLAEVAPATPGMVHGLPKLPPGLLDAPDFNPFGVTVDTRSYPVETTWLVWLQTGWWSPQAIEQQITLGKLPEVALSWPPIKKETFVAVDGRTGELRPDGIFEMTSIGIQPPYPPHHRRALELARERAGHWLRNERQARSP